MFKRRDVRIGKRHRSNGLISINIDFSVQGLMVSCDNMPTNLERYIVNISMFDPKDQQIGLNSRRLSSNSSDIQSIVDKDIINFAIHSVNKFLVENRDRVFRLIFE